MRHEFKFSYQTFSSKKELSQDQIHAINAADRAKQNAYAPFSNFKVGAALLLHDNSIVTGCNQENKAFPSGLCAERVALFSYGTRENKPGIKILAITGDGEMLKNGDFFTPCGACRQVMAEFSNQQEEHFEIILKNKDNTFTVFEGIHQLLPFIFGNK